MWFIPIHRSGKSLEPTCQPRKIPVVWGGCGWGFMVQQVWGKLGGWGTFPVLFEMCIPNHPQTNRMDS